MAVRTLDDRDVLRQAIEDPEGLLEDLDGAGFIVEAQRARGLFLALKAVVDREQRLDESHRGWDALFHESTAVVLAELERRAAESGALDWRIAVETGGFPRALAAPAERRKRLLDDYVEVFASRDIRELLAIESTDRFEQFTRLVAARTGQVLNSSGLSADLGIPVSTVRRWLGALERSFLVEQVPAFSRNAGHRVIKAPKLFMTDVALALAAAQEPQPTGFHLENLVASDLMVWRDAAPGRLVHHWRTQSGQEVDFVVERNQRLVPVELKTATCIGDRDARHLRAFLQGHDAGIRGILLSADDAIRELRGGVVAAPWWAAL